MSVIGNPSTPASYVAAYSKAFVGLFGMPVGGFVSEVEKFGGESGYSELSLYGALLNGEQGKAVYSPTLNTTQFATKLVNMIAPGDVLTAEQVTAAVAVIVEYYGLVNDINPDTAKAATAMALVEVVSNGTFEGDATYGDVYQQFINKMAIADYYTFQTSAPGTNVVTLQAVLAAVDAGTDVTDPAAVLAANNGGSNEAAASHVLTTTQNVVTGGSGADVFRGVAGSAVGAQDQTTFNSSDILDGGAGSDTLIVNMTGSNYAGGARVKNIETLQVGTNLTAAVANGATTATAIFDYNVNQGSNEVTEVTTIVADQINTGEDLAINNVLMTGTANPTLHWKNEAGSIAGEVDYNYRSSAVAGTTDQAITLENVTAGVAAAGATASSGVLNIAQGVETFSILSAGAGTNTLNNSETTSATGVVADLVSGTSGLVKVVVTGAAAFGKAATVVSTSTDAWYGLTNRALTGTDLGGDLATSTARAASSNLVSLADTVTEYDANAATGAQNVRFTAKVSGAETHVAFKGGTAADYVEFEVGNASATGGAGNDTFAFVNAQNNSTLTTADSLIGGEGTDTIQLGVHGTAATAGTTARAFSLNTTEFNNKSGIDVLDVRGSTSTIVLRDEFVSSADAGTFTVRTDKVSQTSDSSTANTTVTAANEDGMVTTLNLTNLAENRGLVFIGGGGSDRLIVDEASLNSNSNFDGGTIYTAGATTAAAGDYDTITVIDNAVLSRGDLSQVKNFDAFAFVKSDNTSSRTFTVELTEAFMLANTAASNVTATSAQDNTFYLLTGAAANSNSLVAGDTVTVDITDLFNTTTGALKGTLTGRTIDATSLTTAGATVQYVYNGTTYASIAAMEAALAASAALLDNAATTGQADVLASAALNAGVANGATLTAVGAGFNTTTGFLLTGGMATVNNDTLSSTAANLVLSTIVMSTQAAGTSDTLNITDAPAAGANVAVAAMTGVEILNLAAGSAAGFVATSADGLMKTVNASAAATLTLGAGGITFNGSSAADVVTAGGGADVINAGDGANTVLDSIGSETITTGAGADTVFIGAGSETVSVGAGADTVVVVLSGVDSVNLGAADAAADTVVINNADGIAAAAATPLTISNFATANDVLSLGAVIGGVNTATSNGVFVNNATGTGAPAVTALAAGTVLEIASSSYQYTGAMPTQAAVLAHLTGTMGVTGAASSVVTVIAYDGSGNAAVFQAQETGAALGAFDVIELVGIVNGVTADSMTAANFA